MRQINASSAALSARDDSDTAAIAAQLHALHAASDLESTLLAIVRGMANITKAKRATLLIADETGGALSVRATSGGDDARAVGISIPVEGDFRRLLRSCQQLALPASGSAIDRHFQPLLDSSCQSESSAMLVPVRQGEALLATVLLEFHCPFAADAGASRFLTLFADQAALAIQKVRALDTLRGQVRDLSALVTLDDALSEAPDFERLLGEVIERVKKLVDADMGGVMLYDPATDELVLQKPALGASDEHIQQYRVPLSGGGNAVNVFRTGRPYVSNNLPADPIVIQRFVHLYGGRNLITVPLDVDNRRIGVFHVANKRSGKFTDNDLRLVSLLASHLGILIQNARLLENERQTVTKMRELNQVIDRQREGLQRTLAIHDELTRMVLDGQGISAIVATLSRLVANPVAVEDRFANLIGFYPPVEDGELDEGRRCTIAGGGTSAAVRNDPAVRSGLARLGRERRPIRLERIPHLGFDKPRVVAPVVVGLETLGYVYVLESNRSLDEVDLMAVERAATAIALEMMKEKAATEARYKLRGDFLMELLDGSCGPETVLLSRAAYLGIDLNVPRAVLVIDVDDFAGFATARYGEEKIVGLKAKLLDVVHRACHNAAEDAVVSAKSDEVIVLARTVSANTDGHRVELRKLGDFLRAEVRRWLPELSVSVGIGRPCDSFSQYARSYQDARRALCVVKASGQADQTLSFDQLGIYDVLFDPHNRERLMVIVEDALGGLLDYDRQHRTSLVGTLSQFLLHDCRLDHTAAALNIHLNTLRYRLRRIEEISGVQMNTLEGKFTLDMALKLLRTFNRSGDVPWRLSNRRAGQNG